MEGLTVLSLFDGMSCGTHSILEKGMRIRRLTPIEIIQLSFPTHSVIVCSATDGQLM